MNSLYSLNLQENESLLEFFCSGQIGVVKFRQTFNTPEDVD